MRVGRALLGALYIAAGVAHFVAVQSYSRAVPDYLPAHCELVLLSGAAEIAGGVGVLVAQRHPAVGRAAAWGIVLLLVAVWPANWWMATHPQQFSSVPEWALWIRVPLQLPLLWWAWRYTRSG